MTCRETRPLLSLFFDGELEARQMRAVALHSTRCPDCEDELRHFERLQDAVALHVSAMVDEIDVSQVWAGVAPRLTARAPSLLQRLRAWWEERQLGWLIRGPAFAALAGITLLALVMWQRADAPPHQPIASRVDNSAVLDSVQSSVDSVALVTEPETNTTLLWIMDDAGGTVDQVSDEWEGK
jgi:anti-sigma factor RsiW